MVTVVAVLAVAVAAGAVIQGSIGFGYALGSLASCSWSWRPRATFPLSRGY
jgi:hypothetical protein